MNQFEEFIVMAIPLLIVGFIIMFVFPRMNLWLDKIGILKMSSYDRKQFKRLIGK